MTNGNLESVETRLSRLEKQNRWFMRVGITLALLVSVLLLMGQASIPRTVEAHAFVLKDKDGTTRAELSTSGDFVGLNVKDASGENISAIALEKKGLTIVGPGFTILTFPDIVNMILGASGEENDELEIRVGKDVGPSGGSLLSLRDRKGFQLSLGTMTTENKKTGETGTTSVASVAMFDKDGKVIWQAP